ncbi:MAG: type II toxin-antitoxin system Phd/YefM family antitoxin [Defluviitaleaceae bacterium]|nr:type II toxin-antitoxin system Phd/YefM family antitoxin [Defluviitaleaceae bacterium]MCL2262363.1 type II toxin-antitoxin system Phd/YefM family antitoxin [Defluviitaleaceae bacterium]
MTIMPSAALADEYSSISDLCKKKNEPIFLTKNGVGDLVVMSIEAYRFRDEMLDLREKLLLAEANRIHGAKTYSIADVSEKIRGLIDADL